MAGHTYLKVILVRREYKKQFSWIGKVQQRRVDRSSFVLDIHCGWCKIQFSLSFPIPPSCSMLFYSSNSSILHLNSLLIKIRHIVCLLFAFLQIALNCFKLQDGAMKGIKVLAVFRLIKTSTIGIREKILDSTLLNFFSLDKIIMDSGKVWNSWVFFFNICWDVLYLFL